MQLRNWATGSDAFGDDIFLIYITQQYVAAARRQVQSEVSKYSTSTQMK